MWHLNDLCSCRLMYFYDKVIIMSYIFMSSQIFYE